jgi:hypothetical protein
MSDIYIHIFLSFASKLLGEFSSLLLYFLLYFAAGLAGRLVSLTAVAVSNKERAQYGVSSD